MKNSQKNRKKEKKKDEKQKEGRIKEKKERDGVGFKIIHEQFRNYNQKSNILHSDMQKIYVKKKSANSLHARKIRAIRKLDLELLMTTIKKF